MKNSRNLHSALDKEKGRIGQNPNSSNRFRPQVHFEKGNANNIKKYQISTIDNIQIPI